MVAGSARRCGRPACIRSRCSLPGPMVPLLSSGDDRADAPSDHPAERRPAQADCPAHRRRVRGSSRAVLAESKATLVLLTARGATGKETLVAIWVAAEMPAGGDEGACVSPVRHRDHPDGRRPALSHAVPACRSRRRSAARRRPRATQGCAGRASTTMRSPRGSSHAASPATSRTRPPSTCTLASPGSRARPASGRPAGRSRSGASRSRGRRRRCGRPGPPARGGPPRTAHVLAPDAARRARPGLSPARNHPGSPIFTSELW